jgi:hypothetical protein
MATPVGVTGTAMMSRGNCPLDDDDVNVNVASSMADHVLLLLSNARTRTTTSTEPLAEASARRRTSSPNNRPSVDAPNVKRIRRALLLGVESNAAGSLPSTVTYAMRPEKPDGGRGEKRSEKPPANTSEPLLCDDEE